MKLDYVIDLLAIELFMLPRKAQYLKVLNYWQTINKIEKVSNIHVISLILKRTNEIDLKKSLHPEP